MKITKSATDSDKNKYEDYGICFDELGDFSIGNINKGKNVLIFGADMSFSTHASNKANIIYVLGRIFTQGINDSTLYAEKFYSFNFTEVEKKFVLSLHFNCDDSYLFANYNQELKLKQKVIKH